MRNYKIVPQINGYSLLNPVLLFNQLKFEVLLEHAHLLTLGPINHNN